MRPLLIALLLAAPAASAAQLTPDWPCVSPRQPHMTLAQVWNGPQPDEAIVALSRDPAIVALATGVSQRRMPIEEAQAAIADFAKDADDAHLTALMLAVFDQIDPLRTRLLDGISRYGHMQADMSAQIEARRVRMADMEKADKPDFDAIDAEEKALDWDTRIFTERKQNLQFVCETPQILERRAYALGQAIASHLKAKP